MLKIKQNWFKESGDKEYKGRIIAFLTELKYLDYELISEEERKKANNHHRADIDAKKQSIDMSQEKNENEDQQKKELKEAHIESTHDLFINCCKKFEDYNKISSFQKFNDHYSTYESHVEELVTKFQGEIKLQHRNKKKIQKFCLEKMRLAERKAEKDSIALIELYKKEEKKVYREIEKQRQEQMQEKINFN